MEMQSSDGIENGESSNVPPTCSRCGKHIYDGTILKMKGAFLHNSCLQCVICRKQVSGYCHTKGNDVYCRADFIRLFGTRCSSCSKVISPSEGARVANGNAYHSACFTCITCKNGIETGDFFYMREDNKLLCCQDYQNTVSTDLVEHSDSESDESGSDETVERHRSCVSDNQLRMLNNSFQANRNPSRSERRQLSKETGLNTRTVQLWFHNRRIKEKKLNQRNKKQTSPKDVHHFQDSSNMLGFQNSNMTSTNTNNTHNANYWNSQQQINSSLPHAQTSMNGGNFQLYCPLDYLVPNEMPPNIDLSSSDILNGEVITGKQLTGSSHYNSQEHYGRNWLLA